MKKNIINFIEENKIIAICRGIYGEKLVQLVESLYEGGVKLVEVTFDQGDEKCIEKTSEALKELNSKFSGKVKFGAGTVITTEQVKAAKNSGAEYILSPNSDSEIIKLANELGLVTIPGAMTPTEILSAHKAGADFVKLFPAGTLGLKYVKDILGPINNVKFIAAAGVTPENLGEFLKLGFVGAGISNYITNKDMVNSGDFETLTNHAIEIMKIAKN
ncbi:MULTISPECIES: bifunctional 4-hydroxy-2-oxoglutarate aldolase/2-dehydro-3-deoxy-phosphogluconate aldolase [unclassified Clostridium]|uniref:bifunctional 4-hydroxy-2-oxoglutarate aldolase/2-dehydro-3-deoxy-phosphogluconate aldolase n=1 Tax=unclassified Clostridium TaxID=2614128 RepID=UPI00189A845B|nr:MULTISPECIES: bifunctional 4-hydroxy-2-oxoglutarate aldolase/2-dehydro-3-deoxy-phosphogluconate aldolase [unclassified Clostridium]MCR1951130.1 bifunctional 4-hydroxy-2-oxoglutarate aldolase/2-dehydro-3-deoxy-phosphogluconate aldolase [Clostridium sp. DSM 100503]